MRRLRDVNLNLLPVLHALVHHRNVTRAGEALHMSQSAVSDALAQLRHVLGDPLLVKSGRQMVLTDLARSLIPQIDETIGHVQRLLGGPDFDPAALEQRFVIGTADSVVMTLGPPLAAALAAQAPRASVQFVDARTETLRDAELGAVDLVIVPEHLHGQFAGHRREVLYEDEFVCILRRDHPLANKRLTPRAYWDATHVSFGPDPTTESTFEAELVRRQGMRQFERVRVSQFALLPAFVETSDAIAMLPRRIAERLCAQAEIRIAKLPFPSEPVPICMFWNELKHNDPAHRWLREILLGLSVD